MIFLADRYPELDKNVSEFNFRNLIRNQYILLCKGTVISGYCVPCLSILAPQLIPCNLASNPVHSSALCPSIHSFRRLHTRLVSRMLSVGRLLCYLRCKRLAYSSPETIFHITYFHRRTWNLHRVRPARASFIHGSTHPSINPLSLSLAHIDD